MNLDYTFYLMILICVCFGILLFILPVLATGEKFSTKFNIFTTAIIIIPSAILLYFLIRILIHFL